MVGGKSKNHPPSPFPELAHLQEYLRLHWCWLFTFFLPLIDLFLAMLWNVVVMVDSLSTALYTFYNF